MTTRPSLLALSLVLAPPTLAAAQDSRPANKPAAAAVADALVKLRGAKLLKRLTEPRRYVMRRSGEVFLLTLSGAEAGPVLKLKLAARRFTRPSTIEFGYELGSDGAFRAIEMSEVRHPGTPKEDRRGIRATLAEGKLVGNRMRKGKPDGAPFDLPWSDNSLPAIFLWFVVPSLFDQGLPVELTPEVVMEEKLRPGRKFEAATFRRTSAEPFKNKAGVLVHTFEGKGKHDATTIAVIADGPRKGQVLEVKVGRSRSFELITKAQYEQYLKDAPLIANEGKAQSILRSLRYAQDSHRRSKGSFAADLGPLEAQDTYLAKGLQELQSAYLVLVRAAPDGSKWMAIAVPAEPGKTGKRYFVVNQDGVVHASDKKLELDDSCAIPAGAKPER